MTIETNDAESSDRRNPTLDYPLPVHRSGRAPEIDRQPTSPATGTTRRLPSLGAEAETDVSDLYADEVDRFDPDRELAHRGASTLEASGQRMLLRAGFTAVVGGAIITLVSMAFGPRFFTTDVRALGILVGLAIVAMGAIAPIGSDSRKTVPGALIIVAAILAFPIAAGGYFIGSIVSIIGGSLLIAYEPPTDDVRIVVRRAGRIRRITALIVDFVVAFFVQRIMFWIAPDFFSNTFNVVVAWAFAWLFVAVLPMMLTRRTPGRILVVLRLVDVDDAERSGFINALAREVIRGLLAIGSFFLLVRAILGDGLEFGQFAITALVIAAAGFAIERFNILDRVSNSVCVYDAIEGS